MEQVLIKWHKIPLEEATWEDTQDIAEAYPNLNLEDKIALEGEGIVMDADVDKETNELRRSNRMKREHSRWGHFVRK